MTEQEKHDAIQEFSRICTDCATTGITAARTGDTETVIHVAEQIIQQGRQIIRLITTAD